MYMQKITHISRSYTNNCGNLLSQWTFVICITVFLNYDTAVSAYIQVTVIKTHRPSLCCALTMAAMETTLLSQLKTPKNAVPNTADADHNKTVEECEPQALEGAEEERTGGDCCGQKEQRFQKVLEFESPPLHLQSTLYVDCNWLTNGCDAVYV